MFYDLNVPWSTNNNNNNNHLLRTLAFLDELGYNIIALNHTITGKLPPDLTSPIPTPLPHQDLPPNLTILRRCTLVLTETHQNARLAELSKNYDILAVRPVDEKTLQLACSSLDCDIISLDLTQRLPFYFKYKTLAEAIKAGKRFEICYAQAITGDSGARRNLISNATQLIRASRGRGLVVSSEARSAVACRGPWDVVNLACVWGLGQERGVETVGKECRSVVVGARLKRTGWRGVVDVVYGGEKGDVDGEEVAKKRKEKQGGSGQKRKAGLVEDGEGSVAGAEKPVSKRQMKRQAKEAKVKAAATAAMGSEDGLEAGVETSVAGKVQNGHD